MDLEEQRKPPASDFAQRVAYVIYALALLVTIAFPLFVIVMIYLVFSQMH